MQHLLSVHLAAFDGGHGKVCYVSPLPSMLGFNIGVFKYGRDPPI